jgi:hypothetical protein
MLLLFNEISKRQPTGSGGEARSAESMVGKTKTEER